MSPSISSMSACILDKSVKKIMICIRTVVLNQIFFFFTLKHNQLTAQFIEAVIKSSVSICITVVILIYINQNIYDQSTWIYNDCESLCERTACHCHTLTSLNCLNLRHLLMMCGQTLKKLKALLTDHSTETHIMYFTFPPRISNGFSVVVSTAYCV